MSVLEQYVALIKNKAGKKYSNRNKSDKLIAELRTHLSKENILQTTDPQYHQKLNTFLDQRKSQFILFGGDGSLNYFTNTILEKKVDHKIQLILIPSGTGNDFHRNLSSPRTFSKLVEKAAEIKFSPLSIGEISGKKKHYFVNIVGIGLDALALKKYNEKIARTIFKGSAGYIIGLVLALVGHKSKKIRFRTNNNQQEIDLYNLNIGLGKYAGGGMKLCPHADLFKNQFAMTSVRDISLLKVLANVVGLFTGSFIKNKEVITELIEEIRIEAGCNLHLEADGEYLGKITEGLEISLIKSPILIGHCLSDQ